MNKENAHLYLPLVQALADGKTIQTALHFVTNEFQWEDMEDLLLNLPPDHYRIKPEPRTFEMWVTPDGVLWPPHVTPFTNWERITVQEVLK
jgi:hypothetical protein